jgi:hypothetical protein
VLVQEELTSGTDYLALVTRLMHRVRLADPTAGMWEAADLQWWWRRDRASDDYGQLFWLDSQREPVAAVIFTSGGQDEACQCDVIIQPDQAEGMLDGLWQRDWTGSQPAAARG